MHNDKKRVIVVTDGDSVARKAVEVAAKNVGGRCISASYGNPTKLSAGQIIELIHQTPYDPVLVMVDDDGNKNKGIGERVLEKLLKDDSVQIVGAVAVASDTSQVRGVPIEYSVDRNGEIVGAAVDKEGVRVGAGPKIIHGDTVDVLNHAGVPVVGIGDPGKMDHKDEHYHGAPITTRAVQFLLDRAQNDWLEE